MRARSLIFATAVAMGVAVIAAAAASASEINGSLDQSGSFKIVGGWTAPTAIDFVGNEFQVPLGDPGLDDLGGFTDGSIGNIKNLTLSSFVPVTDFYDLTVGGDTLRFDLDTLTVTTAKIANGEFDPYCWHRNLKPERFRSDACAILAHGPMCPQRMQGWQTSFLLRDNRLGSEIRLFHCRAGAGLDRASWQWFGGALLMAPTPEGLGDIELAPNYRDQRKAGFAGLSSFRPLIN